MHFTVFNQQATFEGKDESFLAFDVNISFASPKVTDRKNQPKANIIPPFFVMTPSTIRTKEYERFSIS